MLAVSILLPVHSKVVGKSFQFWKCSETQSVKDDSSFKTLDEIKNRLQQTMSLNAPKSKRISQHHLESTQCEVHKLVVKPSAESTRVVRGMGTVALQMSSQTFTETCAGKLRKTSEPRKKLVSGTVSPPCVSFPDQLHYLYT